MKYIILNFLLSVSWFGPIHFICEWKGPDARVLGHMYRKLIIFFMSLYESLRLAPNAQSHAAGTTRTGTPPTTTTMTKKKYFIKFTPRLISFAWVHTIYTFSRNVFGAACTVHHIFTFYWFHVLCRCHDFPLKEPPIQSFRKSKSNFNGTKLK